MVEFVARSITAAEPWTSIAYGAGKFVSVAFNTAISASSADGATWTQNALPSSRFWRVVVYGNGTFVALVGGSTVFATSPDGTAWTARVMTGTARNWYSAVFGNGVFVAVAFGTAVAATSPDGVTWTQTALPASRSWRSVTFGNGLFVAFAENTSFIATSPDGVTWTERALPVSARWASVAFGNGLFVAVAGLNVASSVSVTSPDGITWTQRALPVSDAWNYVAYGGKLFAAFVTSADVGTTVAAVSADGVNWTQKVMPTTARWQVCAYGAETFAVLANSSTDAATYAWAEPPEVDYPKALVLAGPVLLGGAVLARVPFFASLRAPSVLSGAAVKVLHDFTGQLGDATTLYVMDIVTPGGPLRLPISSWQATLQTGGSNYVQCVVPACAPWAAAINTATEFVIYRRAVLPGAGGYEYEMARAPAEQVSFDQGPERYTCTLSGYSEGFAPDADPPAAYDRDLQGVRSLSSGTSGVRVRCAVDWLLRPGHRAFAGGQALVVDYINYYAPTGFDSYMDVGSRP